MSRGDDVWNHFSHKTMKITSHVNSEASSDEKSDAKAAVVWSLAVQSLEAVSWIRASRVIKRIGEVVGQVEVHQLTRLFVVLGRDSQPDIHMYIFTWVIGSMYA